MFFKGIAKIFKRVYFKTLTNVKIFFNLSGWFRIHQVKKEVGKMEQLLILLDRGDLKEVDVDKYQKEKLVRILRYTNKHCSYYQELFKKYNLDLTNSVDFKDLPLLDKSVIASNKDDIISDEANRMKFYNFNTGGSTGDPMTFYRSDDSGLVDNIHHRFLYNLMGYKVGDKIFSIGGGHFFISEDNKKNNVYWTKTNSNDFPFGSLFYSSIALNKKTVSYYVDHLFSAQPEFLRGYASAISDLADYIIDNNIVVSWPLKGVYLAGEQVYPWQIEKISNAFKTRVFSNYGHSEVSVWAYSLDQSSKYVCSPFYGLVEILDQVTGQPVSVGETGEIVVTGFYNFIFPFIRYRTNDLAVYAGKKNGAVVFDKLIGRTQDFVYNKDGEKIDLMAIFDIHPKFFKHIVRWQVIQNSLGKLLVKIVKKDNFSELDEKEIKNLFVGLCGISPDLEYVDLIPLTKRGKLPFLIQNIK
jgi:phenylacetate-CoA ligase